ncbi:uncharacterized protein YukJ [Kibdelosporangium banguiense]|uniref:Uncharacterized protein YukJ n=1 Tax=Kibdelosporangium banguiense TaxID=1365924 RepID=A0ABS4TZ72_9PSEU|nr:DUF2278 family protein [Kibdelosporangium banguiense]MBP2329676.1 uncharacterized protein YukJ [Kibdelosporangium banguiense]
MPLKSYGVLSGRVVNTRREGSTDTPHYQIEVVDDDAVHYRVAVNVRSQQMPSELLYHVADDFRHPITDALPEPGSGWTVLPSKPGGASLDFIRGNLFDPKTLRLLPPDLAGPDNDLADLFDHYVQRAQQDPNAHLYVFGERWGPENNVPDKIFGFRPGNGVHDIHMNQGNSAQFRRDNGVWQDGGLLIRFGGESRWVAMFLAFQSQSWHTDDRTGHALDGEPDRSAREIVRIVGALVNPVGPAPETETVTLINASPAPVDLTGWQLVDRAKTASPIPSQTLAPGVTLKVELTNGMKLGNNGGAITLLDAKGIKIHGVSYTADQSHDEGWTVVF